MATTRAKLLPLFAAGAVTIGIALPAIAGAQQYPPTTGSTTSSIAGSETTVVTSGVTDPGTKAPTTSKSSLPFTGGDIAGLAAIGAGAIGGGIALARSGRRRRAES